MNEMRPPLFDLARQRLLWAEQRQTVLARNIANASTPGFQPRDLPSFAEAMGRKNLSEPRRTQPNHLPRPQGSGLHAEQAVRPRARSPDGNAVAMDEQLMKVADTDTAQNTTTSIYRKYMTMFSIALGKV
jgi:flagellar basal-body rod protein FlgB